MSVMEKRLQLLLDQERYRRVQQEAESSGRSVAAVIREAIDLRFADDAGDAARREALSRFLERTAVTEHGPGEDWADMKAELEGDLASRFSG